MHSIFKQVKGTTIGELNETKNYTVVKFENDKLEFVFESSYHSILVEHKSQAVIAAVATNHLQLIRYKNDTVQAQSTVFEWLSIPYTVKLIRATAARHTSADGVISFF